MGKIYRNTSTPESKAFWESAKSAAKIVESWPDSKKGVLGIDVPHENDDEYYEGGRRYSFWPKVEKT